jgi:hypothetical protein
MHMPECDFGSMGCLPDMPLIVNLLQNFVQHCSCARQLAFKSDRVILQLGDLHILSFALDLRVGFTHDLLLASVLELSELQFPSNNVQIGSQQHWQRSCEPGGCSHVVGLQLGTQLTVMLDAQTIVLDLRHDPIGVPEACAGSPAGRQLVLQLGAYGSRPQARGSARTAQRSVPDGRARANDSVQCCAATGAITMMGDSSRRGGPSVCVCGHGKGHTTAPGMRNGIQMEETKPTSPCRVPNKEHTRRNTRTRSRRRS